MLVSITLENYALADELDVQFEQGFNVITGETGSGKSLILDALALCSGARADASKVRHGADKTEIYVEFDIAALKGALNAWFTEQDLAITDDLLIRRQILANGRSKAWINGQLINVSTLKSIGEHLIQMHSQHAQTALLNQSYMVDWLDEVADKKFNTKQLKQDMQTSWQLYANLKNQLHANEEQKQARKERVRLLQMQLADVAELIDSDYTSIEKEYDTLSNYEQLMVEASQLLGYLNHEDVGIQPQLTRAIKTAEQQNTFESVTTHLYAALNEIEEAISQMQSFADQPEPDTLKIQQLDQTMTLFHRLARKYEVKPNELSQLSEKWSDELLNLESIMDEDNQSKQLTELYNDFINHANRLDDARKQSAPIICEQLITQLQPLSLENAKCEFSFNEKLEPNKKGISDIEFLFSANKGTPLQPLNKQASGGELSRIALVMQVLNTAHKQHALMVFDEIDVGMSGGTAEVIGDMMKTLGKTQQILAITHQAQVAGNADHHLLVSKTHSADNTYSNIVPITGDGRVHELARMTGGIEITESTLAHAKTLLK